MNCLEATQLMSASLEREISLSERMSLGVHTMMCKGCHNYRQQMGTLRTVARAYAKGKDEQLGKKS